MAWLISGLFGFVSSFLYCVFVIPLVNTFASYVG